MTRSARTAAALLIPLFALCLRTAAAAPEGRAPTDWSSIRGVNYIPGYADSPYQAWTEYQPTRIRVELMRASRLGLNSVRVFLDFNAWNHAPSEFRRNLRDFVDACAEADLTILPVLFDAWGVPRDRRPADPDAGIPVDGPVVPQTEPRRYAYRRFMDRGKAFGVEPAFYSRMLRYLSEELDPGAEVPISNDPSVVFWGGWTPSPDHARLGEADHTDMIRYMKDVVGMLSDEPRVVAWDVMNAPEEIRIFSGRADSTAAFEFVLEMIRALRLIKPSQPVTVGASGGLAGAQVFEGRIDIISLQHFQRPLTALAADVRAAGRREKPVIVTAAGGILFPADEREISPQAVRAHVSRVTTQLLRDRKGFYLWHLTAGRAFGSWTALIGADGTLTPAAEWLAEELDFRKTLAEDPAGTREGR